MTVLGSVSWPLHTPRLTIRPATRDDADATWRFRRLEEVGTWITWWAQDLDDYREVFCEEVRLAKTLVVERDGEAIGDLMLNIGSPYAQYEVREQAKGVEAELGWVLDPAYGGRGYATEAVEALMRLCFEDLGLRRVAAHCFADNEPSWRLMERVGMRRESHTKRESLHRSGEWLDGLSYAMLAEEWQGGRFRAGSVGMVAP